MTSNAPAPVAEQHATPEIRLLTTIAWIAGPTLIFVGWFLMSMIAGSQKPGGRQDGTSLALVFLFAIITSFPLIVVSLIGGATTMLSASLRTQGFMNLFALIWNAAIFIIYFGLLGIVGSLPEDGFPITARTIGALIPIALITTILPIALYIINRKRIHQAASAIPTPLAVASTYDI